MSKNGAETHRNDMPVTEKTRDVCPCQSRHFQLNFHPLYPTSMVTLLHMTVFILQNQHEQYLHKSLERVDGCDANQLFKTPHRDVALNQLMELNAKDIQLRAKIISCELDSSGNPRLPKQPITA